MADSTELFEYADSRGATLQIEEGVIKGVKIIGLESKNGRTYLAEGLRQAIGLYEGSKVNVNHAGKGSEPRAYQDRIGVLKGVHYREGQGLYGDLQFNPKHPLAEQLAWDANHAPENVGLSHNAVGKTRNERGRTVVEAIEKVHSVDLVADPATTKGLFEGIETMSEATITLEAVKARPEIVAALLQEQAEGEEAKAKDAELKRLREENDTFKAAQLLAERKAEIDAELKEAKLPELLVTDVFKQTLLEAKDATARKTLIEDRQAIAKNTAVVKPKSREQNAASLTEGYTASDPKQTAAKYRS